MREKFGSHCCGWGFFWLGSNVVAGRLLSFLLGLFLWSVAAESLLFGQDSFEKPPILYSKTKANDSIAKLARDIRRGKRNLTWDAKFGWLPSLLKELKVSPKSQTLVFSKTSLQIQMIHPKNPRAIYFNDEVYVGWVPGGDLIELSAVDPQLGAVFYSLENKRVPLKPRIKKIGPNDSSSKQETEAEKKQIRFKSPRISRDRDRCLTCHATHKTQNVPGFLVRSVYSKKNGQPDYSLGTITTDSTTAFRDRFGGWYVTGQHGEMEHRGNAFLSRPGKVSIDREAGANQDSLEQFFDVKKYLRPDSDLVALMVLEHQSQMHNAITKATFEAKLALAHQEMMNKVLDREEGFLSETTKRRLDSAAQNVVNHLLFFEESALDSPISGGRDFQDQFLSLGPKSKSGESLRDFDLTKRLFRFPCSFLVYSDAFCQMPKEVRFRCKELLIDVLKNGSTDSGFRHLTPSVRKQILGILEETHPLFRK